KMLKLYYYRIYLTTVFIISQLVRVVTRFLLSVYSFAVSGWQCRR
ncbi:MAG: hypothetical protein ACI90V_003642, partial [Bacillariaceae sp.]